MSTFKSIVQQLLRFGTTQIRADTDSVDLGTAFTYTGCGGRDLKGTKTAPKNLRTAPQTFDQSFDNTMNAALKVRSA